MTFTLLVGLVTTLQPGSPAETELTHAVYSDLLDRYQSGSYTEAARSLVRYPWEELRQRNNELLGVLDVDRPEEARRLRAAIVLHAEAAVASYDLATSDFLLDEAVALSIPLGTEARADIQRRIHLAVAYRLYDERRVSDALHVLRPATRRFPEDAELAYLRGRLEELSGWLNDAERDLERAREAYLALLSHGPNASAELRLSRVLTLLGEHTEALPLVRGALTGSLLRHDRVVAQIVLGDALRRSGRWEEALQSYRRAIEQDGRCQAASVSLAHALQQAGRVRDARAEFERYFARGGGIAGGDCFQRYLMTDASRHTTLWRELRGAVR